MPRGVGMAWFATSYGHIPLFAVDGLGSAFRCADGTTFLDMGLAILSAFAGYANPAITRAVVDQLDRGAQFGLPGAAEADLAERLAERWSLPKWQFALSATMANHEVIRVARAITGRADVLLFDGKFHGYLDATLHVPDGRGHSPEYLGLGPDAGRRTRLVSFNDLDAVDAALADQGVAVVLVEPAILNARTILPEPGFHDGLRRMTRSTGTLLAVDETYTLTTGWGGLVRSWGLEPDLVILGKSLGGGLPLGAWGMSTSIAARFEAPSGRRAAWGDEQFVGRPNDEIATGGTLSANALSIAAGLAMLDQVLTPEVHRRTIELADRLEGGIASIIAKHGLPWTTMRLANRAGYWWSEVRPRNAAEQRAAENEALSDTIRAGMLLRGIFEAGGWSNPTIGAAHTTADVDAYLAALDGTISELRGDRNRRRQPAVVSRTT